MAAAFVQQTGSKEDNFLASTISATLTVTSGNVVVGYVYWDNSTATTLNSVADGTNSYTLNNNPTSSTAPARGASFHAVLTTSGSITITATISSARPRAIIVHEVSGIDTTTPLRGSNAAGVDFPGTGANTISTGAVSVQTGDYMFAAVGCVGFGDTFTAGTTIAWTSRHNETDLASEDRVSTATESRAATFGNTGDNRYVAAMVALAAASATGPTLTPAQGTASFTGQAPILAKAILMPDQP